MIQKQVSYVLDAFFKDNIQVKHKIFVHQVNKTIHIFHYNHELIRFDIDTKHVYGVMGKEYRCQTDTRILNSIIEYLKLYNHIT